MKVNVEPVESGQLTIKPAMPTNGYIAGTKLTVNAIPYKGFKFREWTGDFSSKNRTIIITVDSDKEITANFVPETASSSSLVPLISIGIGIIVAIGVVLFLLLRRKKTPPEAT